MLTTTNAMILLSYYIFPRKAYPNLPSSCIAAFMTPIKVFHIGHKDGYFLIYQTSNYGKQVAIHSLARQSWLKLLWMNLCHLLLTPLFLQVYWCKLRSIVIW